MVFIAVPQLLKQLILSIQEFIQEGQYREVNISFSNSISNRRQWLRVYKYSRPRGLLYRGFQVKVNSKDLIQPLFNLLQGCYHIIYIIIIITSGSITKAIGDFFKEIFLIFSIVLGKDFSVFLKLNIKKLILALVIVLIINISGLVYIGIVGPGGFYIKAFR